MNVKRTVKNSMPLAHIIAMIVENTELTEQEIMMLSLDEIITTFKISERTFRRYISEINCYFTNNYIFKQIIFVHKDKTYSLCTTL